MTETKKKNAHGARRLTAPLFWSAIVLAGGGALVWAWLPKPEPAEFAVASVQAMRVTVDEDGVARVKERHTVSSPLSGNIARIHLHVGDSVKRGSVMARIMPLASPLLDARTRATGDAHVLGASAAKKQTRSMVERAKIALEQAEREVARTKNLAASGAVPQIQMERAELELRARREELASAELGVKIADHELEVAELAQKRMKGAALDEQFEVTAPIDGTLLKIFQQSEGVVMAGTPLVEIGDPGLLEIAVDILTSEAVLVKPGARVSVERWGGENLRGHVRMVEPSAFTKVSALGVEESRVNSIIDLDEPREKWHALGDGYRLEARIIVWEAPDALVVPDAALFREGEGWALFVVREGKAHLTKVEVGKKNGRSAQILRGVSAGDEVLVHPSDKITEGKRVAKRGN